MMIRAMYALLAVVTRAFDLLLYPFRNLAPVWGVAFLALPTAIFVLLAYRRCSDQAAIRRLKKLIQGHFLGIYLFRDDVSQILLSLGKVCANALRYMGHSLPPLAVVILPIALVCAQMQVRYGYRNLRPGERAIVSIELAPGIDARAAGSGLRASDGLRVETPPLTIGSRGEIDWRIRVEKWGAQRLVFSAGGSVVEKGMSIDSSVGRLYPVRAKGSLINSLIYPGDEPIARGAQIRAVIVGYPSARVRLLGIGMHWSVAYFILTIVCGMMLKRVLGVEF